MTGSGWGAERDNASSGLTTLTTDFGSQDEGGREGGGDADPGKGAQRVPGG